MSRLKQHNQGGFLAISLVLVIAAVVLAISISVTYSSIGEGQSGLAMSDGEQALSLVEGCTEDALLKIRASSSYTGGTITRPEGSCTVTVGSGVLTVVNIGGKYTRTVQVQYTRTSKITITLWKEI